RLGGTTRAPVGVIGMITPWNFPVAIPSWKIFPALLAGNGVVLKPSEHAPGCAEAFVAACYEAGVPDGLIQVVHGFAEPAAALAVHPGVRPGSFSGSLPTGRLGDPTDPGTDVGPVINAASAERIAGIVADAIAEGASPACGGRVRADVFGCDGGTFFEPTVLVGVEPHHRIAREEVFGPVLAV